MIAWRVDNYEVRKKSILERIKEIEVIKESNTGTTLYLENGQKESRFNKHHSFFNSLVEAQTFLINCLNKEREKYLKAHEPTERDELILSLLKLKTNDHFEILIDTIEERLLRTTVSLASKKYKKIFTVKKVNDEEVFKIFRLPYFKKEGVLNELQLHKSKRTEKHSVHRKQKQQRCTNKINA